MFVCLLGLAHWKAHTRRITSVQFVDRWSTVVTGSTDGSVRLWTIQGQYIGRSTYYTCKSLSRYYIQ